MADTVVRGVLAGTFTEISISSEVPVKGLANVLIEKGDGTVSLEKSFDNGVSWEIVSLDSAGAPATYTSTTNFNGNITEPEFNVIYRLNCTVYVSDIKYRISRSQSGGRP